MKTTSTMGVSTDAQASARRAGGDQPTVNVKALITLHYNGKPIKPNETVDIKDEEAESLIERGFVIAVSKADTTAEPQGPTIDDIVDIIAELDPEQDFGKSGKPHVEAIEALLDTDITAEQRDKAWDIYKAEKDAV